MSGEAPRGSVHLAPGLEAEIEKVVPPEWTIAHFDARLPPVFSTPAMIGMMEVAAARAVQASLPPGSITVGTRIEVDHLKAVPSGRAFACVRALQGCKASSSPLRWKRARRMC